MPTIYMEQRKQDKNDAAGYITLFPESSVILELKQILHRGEYNCDLIGTTDNPDMMVGCLVAPSPDSLHCCAPQGEDENATDAIIERGKNSAIMNIIVEKCIFDGIYFGKEIYINTIGHYIASLRSDRAPLRVETLKKRHCCLYCAKLLCEITPHILTQHRNEQRVQEILQLPVSSKKRYTALKELRISGDALFNDEVENAQKISLRRFDLNTTPHLCCPGCSGILTTKGYIKHRQLCIRPDSEPVLMSNNYNETCKKNSMVCVAKRLVQRNANKNYSDEQALVMKRIKDKCEDGLAVKTFAEKGRGVVTTRPFVKDEYIVEYIGDLITFSEAKAREAIYARNQNIGCYMYYFKFHDKKYCIDATEENGTMGRLVNHSRKFCNSVTRLITVEGKPHLVLFAKRNIQTGEEINYDYGDLSAISRKYNPWLAC